MSSLPSPSGHQSSCDDLPELAFNWDHTRISIIILGTTWTMELKGTKCIKKASDEVNHSSVLWNTVR